MIKQGRIFLFAAIALPVAASGAHAQSLARLLACSDLPRAEERLQCYDAAARSAIGLGASAQPAASGCSASSAALDARARQLDARERALRADETKLAKAPNPVPAAAPAPAALVGGNAAIAKREAALAEREAAIAQREARVNGRAGDDDATIFGIPIPFTKNDPLNKDAALQNQEVVRDEDGIVESISSPIVGSRMNADGRLTFVLANGQVWRQTDGATPFLKGTATRPDMATIARGALGSFTLKLNSSNRLLRVQRVDVPKAKP